MDVERGEIVGFHECPSCGDDIPMKVTKHGLLFGKCFNVVNPEAQGHGKYCRHVLQYSDKKSREIINNYLEVKGKNHVQTERQEPETKPDGEPSAGVEQRGEDPAGSATEEPKPKAGRGFFSSFFDD